MADAVRRRRIASLLAFALGACTVVGVPPGEVPPPASPPRPVPEAPPEPAPGPERGQVPDAARDPAPPAPTEEDVRVAPRTFQETRGLWVVRTTLVSPASVQAMVDRAQRAGFNALLVQVRGRGDAWYASVLEPAPPELAGRRDFDPLALVVREAHARGMAVHAWVNALLVGGLGPIPTDPRHLAVSRPEGLAVPRPLARELFGADPRDPAYARRLRDWADDNRHRVEGLFAGPSDPVVRRRLTEVIQDLGSRYDLDGIHLDYIRYPGPDFDYSRGALEAFRGWMAERVPASERAAAESAWPRDPLAYTEAFPAEWADFRREQVTRLAEEAAGAARLARPGVVVSAAVFPDPEDARRSRFQDWGAWARWGVVDAVAPMAYTGDANRYREQMADAVEAAGAGRVWAGIGVYQTDFRGTVDRIRWSRELGTAGFSLFSYDWAVASGEAKDGVPFLDRVGREALGR